MITSVLLKKGIAAPLQSGQPSVPLPPGPQPRPDSLTRTIPPSDDQGEGRENGQVCKAAKPTELVTRRRRHGGRPSESGYRLAAFGCLGLAARGAGRLAVPHRVANVAHRLGAADVREHVEVVRPEAARAPATRGSRRATGRARRGRRRATLAYGLASASDDARRSGPRRRSSRSGCRRREVAGVEVLVDVHRLALEAGEEHREEGEVGADEDQPRATPLARLSPMVRPVIFGNQ